MDRLTIKNVRLYGHYGVSENERSVGAAYEIDVEVFYSAVIASENDSIDSTVDYGEVCKCIKKSFKGASCRLIESAADNIARSVLSGFSEVQKVTIRIRKRPPIDASLDYVEFETTRSR